MQVIAISASPRPNGNSEILLDALIGGLHSGGVAVEKIRTHDLDLLPCTGCGRCIEGGRCRIGDDFENVRKKLIWCDGVVFASPLYFMNVPARGKALIDRCQSFWIARHRLGIDFFGGRRRFGILAACSGAGHGPGGADVFRGIEDTMTYFFEALGLTRQESVLVRKVDAAGDILARTEALHTARITGEKLSRFS